MLEFLLSVYVVITVFALIFGLIGLVVTVGDDPYVRELPARIVVLSFVWPVVVLWWVGLLLWWIWKTANLTPKGSKDE